MSSLPAQVATVLFGRGVIRIAQLVTFVLLARSLSAAQFGWFGVLTSALALAATLGTLGLRQSFAYWIGQRRLTGAGAAATGIALWLPLTLLASAFVYALFGTHAPVHSPATAALIIFTSMAGTVLITLLQGVNLGRGNIRAFTLGDTLPRVLLLIGVALLAVTGTMTLEASLWVQSLCYLLTIPTSIWFALRGERGAFRPQGRSLLPMLRYGIFFALNLFLITLCSRISMFVIQGFQGAQAAGQFYAAVRVNEIFLEASTALGMVIFSRTARQVDARAVLEESARLAAWLLWGFLLIAGLIAAAAPVLVRVLLGSDYEGAAGALQVLALSLAPTAATKVVYSTIAGIGRPTFGTPLIAVSLGVNLVASWLLVPGLGVPGGSAALVIGQVVLLVGYAILCRRNYRIPMRTFFLPPRSEVAALVTSVQRRSRTAIHGLLQR
ncbi:polysaccharide biosynthesis C-terminal domain-containing protein [Amnibacterium sp. CER49]|uniref:oligosaccharide flippase family protein n=1 Tax=Amnibacterium sp. CER49 TaxID=3039161 RepID=UPI0024490999|nr:oligosaccharide flippase family protein [Amnibacterium sp. CER49]MDH2443013.1 polysaccharide biosynthesis C-terminal domain-containing protein [Amnibacterium sp. CER49]